MDDFFGGLFDFDGDGRTDWVEEAMGLSILDAIDAGTGSGGEYVPDDFSGRGHRRPCSNANHYDSEKLYPYS